MIKRIVEISRERTSLSIKLGQLIIKQDGQEKSIPCEDIGILLIDNQATFYTHCVLTELLHHGSAVIICNGQHLPAGMLLPLETNTIQSERFRHQINAKIPLKKKLWQQVIRAKIAHQADVINNTETAKALRNLRDRVRSGDPDNIEAQASQKYWRVFIQGIEFKRNPDGSPPNNLLNYGYMVMRAAVARAICSTGLLPTLGIHHHNRYNAYCLADDMVEPFRGYVEKKVREICSRYSDISVLNQELKAMLLEVLYEPVSIAGFEGPLMVGLHRTMASLSRCFEGVQKNLELPEF